MNTKEAAPILHFLNLTAHTSISIIVKFWENASPPVSLLVGFKPCLKIL